MGKPQKFTFDTGFGTRSQNTTVDAPVILQADVDAARTQGFVQGREDGLSEAQSQINSDFENSINNIGKQLTSLVSQQARTHKLAMEQSEKLALLISKKIASAALKRYPTEQITALVSECLGHVNTMPRMMIKINQSILQLTKDTLQPHINEMGFEGKTIITGDDAIPVGDCAIEWENGGVSHDTRSIIQSISKIIEDYFGYDADAIEQPAPSEEADFIGPMKDVQLKQKDETRNLEGKDDE